MTARCEYPGCRDTASRKFPEMVERDGRSCCIFRTFCAAHVPTDVMHMTAPVVADPADQIHVPRVAEVTGKKSVDELAAEAEWRRSQELLSARRAFNGRRNPSRSAVAHARTRSF